MIYNTTNIMNIYMHMQYYNSTPAHLTPNTHTIHTWLYISDWLYLNTRYIQSIHQFTFPIDLYIVNIFIYGGDLYHYEYTTNTQFQMLSFPEFPKYIHNLNILFSKYIHNLNILFSVLQNSLTIDFHKALSAHQDDSRFRSPIILANTFDHQDPWSIYNLFHKIKMSDSCLTK